MEIAWVKTQKGPPTAELYYDTPRIGFSLYGTVGNGRGVLHAELIAVLPVKSEDEGLTLDQLKAKYPCPS